MSINLNGFWQSWGVVSGNTQATNEYEFWKGMKMSNGQVLNNQYDFFTYHNTTRYEWFKALQGTYPQVWDEYTFYKNTSDARIYDFYTFYQYCGEYLTATPVTPTPTPTSTPTPTPTPSPTPTPTPTPSPPPFDSDAAAYLAAVIATGGTVNSTISAATNTLFTDLKSAGIYNELLAFYPVIGSTSNSTRLNGKRSNSQFDILWLRPDLMTFDYSGVTGTGGDLTGGITYIVPNNDLTIGNRHMSFYSTNDKGTTTFGYELGGANGNWNVLIVSYTETTGYFSFSNLRTFANTDKTGFYYTQVSGSSSPYTMLGYKNGTEVLNTTSDDALGGGYLSVLCDNRAGAPLINITESSDKRMSWASFGNELTLTQIGQYEQIINDFQTALGRNTY